MDPLELREIGKTGVRVTQLGMGTGTLGDLRELISESQADATVTAGRDGGIRFYDTAPFYGHGKSEHRVGHVLRTLPRDEFVLSTKIGRIYSRPPTPEAYEPYGWKAALPFNFRVDYSRDGVLRSYEDSLQRLGMTRVDALLVHDLDLGFHKSEERVEAHLDDLDAGGGYATLREMKDRGEIRAIGAGINELGMIPRFLERFEMDYFLIAMPYTLLSQEALDREMAICAERGIGIVIGAPFASGILARGPETGTYAYAAPPAQIVEKTRRISAVCARHSVPLGAAALQFPLGHPIVAAVIPGPNSPEQAQRNLEWVRAPIPADLWAELKAEGLILAHAPTPA